VDRHRHQLREEAGVAAHNATLGLDEIVVEAPQGIDRRSFLHQGAALGACSLLGATFETFLARAARGQAPGPGYGPLAPVVDPSTGLPLLKLPEGFRYFSFGWAGDPMRGGVHTPALHDGMAVVRASEGRVVLVRNHEQGSGAAFRAPTWDPDSSGGTTNILFNTVTGQVENIWASISGSVRNCAGGATPWGTWLTCEENFSGGPTGGPTKTHGWIFEVPAFGWAAPVPLTDMGRFSHEAIAVDPATDIVYETEDSTDNSGFYRFVPNVRQALRMGGTLQMLVASAGAAPVQDLRGPLPVGTILDVSWVTVPNPSLAGVASPEGTSVFNQGFSRGGARFFRLEGAWYGNGKIYFNDTGGDSGHFGQVWELDPAAQQLRLIFSSPDRETLDQPDNIAVSPRSGGLIHCEDGGNPVQRLQGMTLDGLLFPFAENNIVIPSSGNPKPRIAPGSYAGFEWAGATFVPGGPDGQWLLVNIQTPGVTFAITGPWDQGAL
jgi:secreted PhoX family phosphatase